MITNIQETLGIFRQKDNMQSYTELLEEFRQLSGVETYLNGDSEDFYEIDSYVELLNGMAALAASDVKMADVDGKIENGQYVFTFTLNGEPVMLSMSNPDTDWLQPDFVEMINEKLASLTSKRFHDVFTTGINNVDQCFEIAFIDQKTLESLAKHPAVFAEIQD